MDELTKRSLFNLGNSKEVAKRRDDSKVPGLQSKTFQGFDADQGQLQLGDSIGGIANTKSQGSLSNAAIQTGKPVSSYGWDTADWRPTDRGDTENIDLAENDTGLAFQLEVDVERPDAPTFPDGPFPDGTNPIPQRCVCQNVWYRGTPNRPQGDDDKIGTDPVPGIVNYEFFNVTTDEWLPASREVFSPYELVRYGPNSPECGASIGGCIIAEWDGGSQSMTATQSSQGDELNLRFIEFTPGAGYVEPTEGPPADTDPGQWNAVKVCDLPVSTSQQDSGDRTLLFIRNGSGQLVRRLSFNKDERISVRIRCEEDGPPEL